MAASVTVKGVVRGETIELEQAPGLPDGQQVIEPAPAATTLPAGDGLRRSAGAWSDDVAGLERYLRGTREQRKHTRRELDPRAELGFGRF